MTDFKRGEIVYIRDFPLGKPTRTTGKVVGLLPNNHYNVLLTSGMNEGTIITYKSYKLIKKEDCDV